MDMNGEAGGENLSNFLESIELTHYQDAIRNELKVSRVNLVFFISCCAGSCQNTTDDPSLD